MKKAIFLDRDGVINKELGYVSKLENFVFTDDIIPTLKKFQENGFLFVVITNQGGIAKGFYTHADVAIIHEHMISVLKENEIIISEIYYCPHHPDSGNCICRKPDSGMLEKAIARFNIDPSKSFMIGDKERDFMAGEKAGVRGIQIESDSPLIEIANKIIAGTY